MPHVSSKKLSEKNFKRIYDQLIKLFDTAGTNRRSDILLNDILTDVEKIMIAKRLAVICMLHEQVSKAYISGVLLLSPTTVNKISVQYETGKYNYIKDVLKKNSRSVWKVLSDVIEEGIAMKVGKKRLAWLDEINRRYDRSIFK